MKSRDLLARLTLAITATSLPIVACGGETVQGPGPGVTTAGGNGGTGGSGGSGGTAVGKGGTGGTGGSGTGAAAGSGGVGGIDCSNVDCYSPPCPEGTEIVAQGPGCCPTLTCRTIGQPTCPSFVANGDPVCKDGAGCSTPEACSTGKGGTGGTGGSGGAAGTGASGSGGSGATCNRELPAKGGQGFGEACRTIADCPDGGFGQCLRPDESLCAGGGGAPEPSCTDDASCGGSAGGQKYVCQARETGGSACALACTNDASCGASQQCDLATGHCVARSCGPGAPACPAESFCADGKCAYQQCNASRPCGVGLDCSPTTFTCQPRECDVQKPGSCPDTFTCLPLSSQPKQICVRTTCKCDTQCGASGFCLSGTCYESAGTCSGNIACGRPLLLEDGVRVSRLIVGDSAGWS